MSITIRPDKESWNKFWAKQQDIVRQHKKIPGVAIEQATMLVWRRVKLRIAERGLIKSARYRGSVGAVVQKIGDDIASGMVGSWIEYAPYLEYRKGWYHKAPEGFKIFESVMEDSFDDIIKIIMIELGKIK